MEEIKGLAIVVQGSRIFTVEEVEQSSLDWDTGW